MGTGYTPIYQIKKDDIDITGHFNDRCVQMRIDYDAEGDDTALFTIDDRDWAVARPNVGERLKIWLGYVEVGLCYMGSFEVSEVTFTGVPKSIILKCSAQGKRNLYKSAMTEQLDGKTLGEIAGILAKRGGFQALVHPKVANTKIAFKNMTVSPQQMAFELKRLYGLTMKVVDGKLVAKPVDDGESGSGSTMPTVVFTQEHFGSWSVKHNQAGGFSHVMAPYVDPQDHVTKFKRYDLPNVGNENGPPSETPYAIERKFNTAEEAEAAAKAQGQALQRSLGEADLQLAKGDPWISDSQRILIRGMRDGVNGSYVTSLVSHTYLKDQGILSSIKAKGDSNGVDYESLFDEASPEQQKQMFLVPGAGGLIGALFRDGGAGITAPGIVAGRTIGDFIGDGFSVLNPFGAIK